MPQQTTNNIYKIPGNSNVYILLKPEPFIIDASDRVDSEHIKSEIEQIISSCKIKKILLTHLHYDHCGNLDLFPKAKVYASKVELENFKKRPEDFFSYNISPESKQMILNAKPLPKTINNLEIIETPGHTEGSVVFLDKQNKILFSGDTIFEKGIGRTDLPTAIPEKMKDTVIKLIKLVREKNLKVCAGHDY